MAGVMGEPEVITYKGIKFTRYPSSDYHQQSYFQPHWRYKKKGIGMLHQEVYKDHYGPIPEGMVVHHKDLNPSNNRPDNLELLTPSEHSRLHHSLRQPRPQVCQQCGVNFMDKGERPAKFCSDLCRSRHFETKRKKPTRVCEQCGATFETRYKSRFCGPRCSALSRATMRTCEWCGTEWLSKSLAKEVRFCSPKCHDAWVHSAKVRYEQRTCAVCGKTFDIYRSSPIRTCSVACGQRLRRMNHGDRTYQ